MKRFYAMIAMAMPANGGARIVSVMPTHPDISAPQMGAASACRNAVRGTCIDFSW